MVAPKPILKISTEKIPYKCRLKTGLHTAMTETKLMEFGSLKKNHGFILIITPTPCSTQSHSFIRTPSPFVRTYYVNGSLNKHKVFSCRHIYNFEFLLIMSIITRLCGEETSVWMIHMKPT